MNTKAHDYTGKTFKFQSSCCVFFRLLGLPLVRGFVNGLFKKGADEICAQINPPVL